MWGHLECIWPSVILHCISEVCYSCTVGLNPESTTSTFMVIIRKWLCNSLNTTYSTLQCVWRLVPALIFRILLFLLYCKLMTNSMNVGFLIFFFIWYHILHMHQHWRSVLSFIGLVMITWCFSAVSMVDRNKCFVQANKKGLVWLHISCIKFLSSCRWDTLLLFPPDLIFLLMATLV